MKFLGRGTVLNNILRRKTNLIGHILKNCLLRDAVGQMTEVKEVGRGRHLLDDLSNRGAKGGRGGSKKGETIIYHTKKYKSSSISLWTYLKYFK